MQRRKKRIDASLRSKILQESMVSGCNLAGLAREHQIPARTLYAWRKKSCRNKADSDVALGTTIQAKDRFVEVKLPEQIKAGSSIKLKRAVLEFGCSSFFTTTLAAIYLSFLFLKRNFSYIHFLNEMSNNRQSLRLLLKNAV